MCILWIIHIYIDVNRYILLLPFESKLYPSTPKCFSVFPKNIATVSLSKLGTLILIQYYFLIPSLYSTFINCPSNVLLSYPPPRPLPSRDHALYLGAMSS